MLHERLLRLLRCSLTELDAAAKGTFYHSFGLPDSVGGGSGGSAAAAWQQQQEHNRHILLWASLPPAETVPQSHRSVHVASLRQACAAVLTRCSGTDLHVAAAAAAARLRPSADPILAHACHGLLMLWANGFQDQRDVQLLAKLCSTPRIAATLRVGDVAAVIRLAAQMLPSQRTIDEHLAVVRPLAALVTAHRQPAVLADAVGEVVQAHSRCADPAITGDARSIEQLRIMVSATTAAGTAGQPEWLQWSEMLRSFKVFMTASLLDDQGVDTVVNELVTPAFKAALERYLGLAAAASNSEAGAAAAADERLTPRLQARVATLAGAYTARAKSAQKRVLEDKAASAHSKRARSECAASTAAAVAAAKASVVGTATEATVSAAIQHLRDGLHALGKIQASQASGSDGRGCGGGAATVAPAAAAELKQIASEIAKFTSAL